MDDTNKFQICVLKIAVKKTISCCIQINDSGLSGSSTYLALISMWKEQLPIENYYYLTKIDKFSPFFVVAGYLLLNSCPFSLIKFTSIDYLSIICDWWFPNVCHYGENRKVLNKNRNFGWQFSNEKKTSVVWSRKFTRKLWRIFT